MTGTMVSPLESMNMMQMMITLWGRFGRSLSRARCELADGERRGSIFVLAGAAWLALAAAAVSH